MGKSFPTPAVTRCRRQIIPSNCNAQHSDQSSVRCKTPWSPTLMPRLMQNMLRRPFALTEIIDVALRKKRIDMIRSHRPSGLAHCSDLGTVSLLASIPVHRRSAAMQPRSQLPKMEGQRDCNARVNSNRETARKQTSFDMGESRTSWSCRIVRSSLARERRLAV